MTADDILSRYVAAIAARHGVPSVDFVATRGAYCAHCGTGRRTLNRRGQSVGKGAHIRPDTHPDAYLPRCSDCGREWQGRSVLEGKINGSARTPEAPTTGRRIVVGARGSRAPEQTIRTRPTRPAPAKPGLGHVEVALALAPLVEQCPRGMGEADWSACLVALFGRIHAEAIKRRYNVDDADQAVATWGTEYRPEHLWTAYYVRWRVREARRVIERRAAGVATA